jgi:hypothetical protein
LDIADQEQDLLGSGEADTTSLAEAVRQRSSPTQPFDTTQAADVLRRWLDRSSGTDAQWASPAFFVEGFLRAFELFQLDPCEVVQPVKPRLGLHVIQIDVPSGMKTKLYDGGIEMRNRDVQIIVCELDDACYEIRTGAVTRPTVALPPDWPWKPDPDLRDELDSQFKIGEAAGLRAMTRNAKSALTVMCTYFLVFPFAKVEVDMFARKKLGADLSKYEAVLATIRAR